MHTKQRTELQAYAHEPNNIPQFIKGFLLGSGAGLVVVFGCVAAAYALGFPGIQDLVDEFLGLRSFAL